MLIKQLLKFSTLSLYFSTYLIDQFNVYQQGKRPKHKMKKEMETGLVIQTKLGEKLCKYYK